MGWVARVKDATNGESCLILNLICFNNHFLPGLFDQSRGGGGGLGSCTRNLVSKTCSRRQERKNQEVRAQEFRRLHELDQSGNNASQLGKLGKILIRRLEKLQLLKDIVKNITNR